MSKPPVVAIGFLTQPDLERLGQAFRDHIPIVHDDLFANLLAELDRIEIEPLGSSVLLRPPRKP
jgi:hypothetical protein